MMKAAVFVIISTISKLINEQIIAWTGGSAAQSMSIQLLKFNDPFPGSLIDKERQDARQVAYSVAYSI